MATKQINNFQKWRPHPWHGLEVGKDPPVLVNAYIEITPNDGIKYEIDKNTGYLKVDRPQLFSSLPPALYGFIPKTYCDKKVAKCSKTAKDGDHDPLDICVLSERPITKNEIIVPCRVIGGLRLIDKGQADDKIIAVLENDPYCENIKDISDGSPIILQRLKHYFLTYKLVPGKKSVTRIECTYGLDEAKKVIKASQVDYALNFT